MNNKGNGAWVAIPFGIVLVGVLFFVLASVEQVDANHLGVKVHLGTITGTMEPGIEFVGPLTNVYQYDMRIRKAKVDMLGADSAADKSGQAIFGSIAVNYRLKGDKEVVQRLYRNVGNDDVIADRLNINSIIKEGFKQATVKFEATEILDKRQEVKELAIQNIKNNFPADYFEIVDIVVENIDFSEGFKNAIEQKKIATQNKLKEQEQVDVVRFQQQQEIEKYKAEAEKLRLQKQEVTALLNEQKMLEKWNGQLPQYLIITPDSNGMFLQLAQGQGMTARTGDQDASGGG